MMDLSNPVTNRSEVVAIFDGVDAAINADPTSSENRPRQDPATGEGIMTDAAFKRLLRDQMQEDFRDSDQEVFVANITKDDWTNFTRAELLARAADVDSPDDVDDSMFDELLAHTADIRLFGATFALGDKTEVEEAMSDILPKSLTGAYQFQTGKTLHRTVLNDASNSLTSVIGNADENGEAGDGGGFGLPDHRLKYALYSFGGVVNEVTAQETKLQQEDVERLDTLFWRAFKNQTKSRKRVGVEPRLYLRVEYNEPYFHIGGLNNDIRVESDRGAAELRTIRDVSLDVTEFVSNVDQKSDWIKTIHVVSDLRPEYQYQGETGDEEFLYDVLRDAVGEDSVHVIDVVEESPAIPTSK